MKFVVVDYIIEDISINNGSNVFVMDEMTGVHASLVVQTATTQSDSVRNDIKNIEKILNTDSTYWWGIIDGEWETWSIPTDTLSDEENTAITTKYDAYKPYATLNDGKTEVTGLGVIAVKQNHQYGTFKLEFGYYYDFANDAGIVICKTNSKTDEANQFKRMPKVVDMSVKISTDIDHPISISYISEYYDKLQNSLDADYILSNDLYFGLSQEQFDEIYEKKLLPENTYTTDSYIPFDLSVKSFDGNTQSIYIFGNINIDTDNASIGLFKQISKDTIVLNLSVEYYPTVKINSNEDASGNVTYSLQENNYSLRYEDISAASLNFGGFAAYNYGVISNCEVHYYGDVSFSLLTKTANVNVAGFVANNSGKITYSSVFGPDWNDNWHSVSESQYDYTAMTIHYDDEGTEFLKKYNARRIYENVKLETSNPGNMATFVCTNNSLISNCQSEFVGVTNTAVATLNAKVAGFVTTNSTNGKIVGSSVAGQRLIDSYIEGISDEEEVQNLFMNPEPVRKSDARIKIMLQGQTETAESIYFARLQSEGNIAGFVYSNSGMIQNTYAAIPFETQSRSAGFVFDNSNAGQISITYTISLYDGTSEYSSAHTPFVGTNDFGEVLNNASTSLVEFSYYLTFAGEIIEDDISFKEPATGLSIEEEEFIGVLNDGSFVGFDFGITKSDVWVPVGNSKYQTPILNANVYYSAIRSKFKRIANRYYDEELGKIVMQYPKPDDPDVPYTIANPLQFVNTFTIYVDSDNVLTRDVRLINDIDLTSYAGTDQFESIKGVIFIGDFDGNGMKISGLKVSGTSSDITNNSIYSNVSDAFGLFYQIGTATVVEDYKPDASSDVTIKRAVGVDFSIGNDAGKPGELTSSREKTSIRNLKIEVKEISRSTSAFTGILAGLIVNTDIKSLEIVADPTVTVLGKNAVGGLAGAIIGNSTIKNVSLNASVTSTYKRYSNTAYREKSQSNINNYSYIDYTIDYTNIGSNTTYMSSVNNYYVYADSTRTVTLNNGRTYSGFTDYRFDLARQIKLNPSTKSYSFAGGIVGIADVYDELHYIQDEEFKYESNTKSKLTEQLVTANLKMLKVTSDIAISGEVVGGLIGLANEDVFMASSKFEVSIGENQSLNGYYTSGGLIGINNGGAVYISTVEVSNVNADSYDNNLTNQTGNKLFKGVNIYPYAIGGIVGLQNGGYIVSSYTKTNVINTSAKYAGGVVGYLSNCDRLIYNTSIIETFNSRPDDPNRPILKYGGYPLLEEVYSTGNVLAGNTYTKTGIKVTAKDTENKSYSFDIAVPNGYAGGIAGGFTYSQYASFSGVDGINAFHKPSDFDVQNNDYNPVVITNNITANKLKHSGTGSTYTSDAVFKINNELLSTTRLEYSHMMSGYFGAKELSNGSQDLIYFEGRIGAVFGEVNYTSTSQSNLWNNVLKLYTNDEDDDSGFMQLSILNSFGDDQYNLFDRFVYNNATVSTMDCKTSNGSMILHVANVKAINSSTTYNSLMGANYLSQKLISVPSLKPVDSYEAKLQGKDVTIRLNRSSTNLTDTRIHNFSYADTYLLFRGLDVNGIRFSSYEQNESGMYYRWSNNWEYIYSIYPKLKPNDTGVFKPIYTEQELQGMRSGTKYRVMNDIYLTKPWTYNKSLINITLVSAKRDDGLGLRNSATGSQSSYYTIYNINMVVEADGSNSNYGFFRQLAHSTIKNLNFVFGTTYVDPSVTEEQFADNPTKYDWSNYNTLGFNYNSSNTMQNIGYLVGRLVSSSSIINCDIYLDNTSLTSEQTSNGVARNYKYVNSCTNYTNANFGIVAGLSTKSSIVSQTTVKMCTMSFFEKDDKLIKTYTKTDGHFLNSGSLTDNEVNVLLSGPKKNCNINVGGLVGLAEIGDYDYNQNSVSGFALFFSGNSVNYDSTNPDAKIQLNVGSMAGTVSGKVIDNWTSECSVYVNGFSGIKDHKYYGTANIGGLVGYASNMAVQNSSCSSEVYVQTTRVESFNVGGFIGSGNNISVYDSHSTSNLISVDGGKTVNVGGFIGYLSGTTTTQITNCYTDFGNLYAKQITSDTGYSFNVAGFVTNPDKSYIYKCYTVGNISNLETTVATASSIVKIDGFVNSLNTNGKIMNCTASVDMNLNGLDLKTAGTGDRWISGFIGVSGGTVEYNVTLGTITYTNGMLSSDVRLCGFTNSSSFPRASENYSLTTIKAVGDNIHPTAYGFPSGTSTPAIRYNYNLTAATIKASTVMSSSSALLSSVGNCAKYSDLIEAAKSQIASNGVSNLSKIYQSAEGTKLNPYKAIAKVTASTTTASTFFLIDNNSVKDIDTASSITLKGNIIAEDPTVASSIQFTKSTASTAVPSIDSGALISGFSLQNKSTDTVYGIFDRNRGYIFNCVSCGKVTTTSTHVSGFVYLNDGFINNSLSMAYIDVKSTSSGASGFVCHNYGIILNSSATNVFMNVADNYGSGRPYFGFFYNNYSGGIVKNCFASPSMFNLNNGSVVSDTYVFYNTSATGGTFSGCYADIDGISKAYTEGSTSGGVTFKNYANSLSQTEDMFKLPSASYGGGSTNSGFQKSGSIQSPNTRCFGYATPTTFVSTAYENHTNNYYYATYGTYFTGNNSSTLTYKVNNYNRYNWLMDVAGGTKYGAVTLDESQTKHIYLNLVHDIDFKNTEASHYNWYSSATPATGETTISIKNLNVYSFQRIGIKTGIDNIGLISAQGVYLKNFGVIGKFNADESGIVSQSGYTTQTISLVVSKANYVDIDSCYAILTEPIKVQKSNSFGLLVGMISNGAHNHTTSQHIKNSFASGDVTIYDYTIKNVGMLLGKSEEATYGTFLENCFASGYFDLEIWREEGTSNSDFGGLFGFISNKGKFVGNYVNVTITNRMSTYYTTECVRAVGNLGSTDGTENNPTYVVSGSSSNFFDDGDISLTTRTHGIRNANCCTRIENVEDFYANSSGNWSRNSSFTTDGGYHFPIQNVFKGNKAVYYGLNISSASRTGSKLSPIEVKNKTGFNNLQDSVARDRHYYLTADISGGLTSSDHANQVRMFMGQGHKITYSDSTGSYAFGSDEAKNMIISRLEVSSAVLVGRGTDCYFKDVKITGALAHRQAFAYVAYNIVFADCTASAYLESDQYSFGGFCIESKYSIYRNVTVDIVYLNKGTTSVRAGGLWYGSTSSAQGADSNYLEETIYIKKFDVTIQNDISNNTNVNRVGGIAVSAVGLNLSNDIVDIKVDKIKVTGTNITTANTLHVAGVCTLLDNDGVSGTRSDYDFKNATLTIKEVDIDVTSCDVFFGGVFAEDNNNTFKCISVKTDSSDSNIKIKTTGSNVYAGMIAGQYTNKVPSNIYLDGGEINYNINLAYDSSNPNRNNTVCIGGFYGYTDQNTISGGTHKYDFYCYIYSKNSILVYAGGFVGYALHTTISDMTLEGYTKFYLNADYSRTACLGGFAGLTKNCTFSNVTHNGLVAGFTNDDWAYKSVTIQDMRYRYWDGAFHDKPGWGSIGVALAVGGISGVNQLYSKDNMAATNLSQSGGVRALLGDHNYYSEVPSIDWDYSKWGGVNIDSTIYSRKDSTRATAGGLFGLCTAWSSSQDEYGLSKNFEDDYREGQRRARLYMYSPGASLLSSSTTSYEFGCGGYSGNYSYWGLSSQYPYYLYFGRKDSTYNFGFNFFTYNIARNNWMYSSAKYNRLNPAGCIYYNEDKIVGSSTGTWNSSTHDYYYENYGYSSDSIEINRVYVECGDGDYSYRLLNIESNYDSDTMDPDMYWSFFSDLTPDRETIYSIRSNWAYYHISSNSLTYTGSWPNGTYAWQDNSFSISKMEEYYAITSYDEDDTVFAGYLEYEKGYCYYLYPTSTNYNTHGTLRYDYADFIVEYTRTALVNMSYWLLPEYRITYHESDYIDLYFNTTQHWAGQQIGSIMSSETPFQS